MFRALCLSAALLVATPSHAHEAHEANSTAVPKITTEKVTDNIHVLFGDGGNIGLLTGPDGVLMVDDKFAELSSDILAAVRQVSDAPLRFLFNTHWHFDHTGGNENMAKEGALIVAHDNVRTRMASPQEMKALHRTVPASPEAALPVLTFGDDVTFHINGETVHALHIPNAHTDGDAIVHFRQANVLHMGDIFFHQVTFPFIDIGSGGSIGGMIAGVEKGLQLANDSTRVIPGHGPMATRAELAAYLGMLRDVRDKVKAAKDSGQTREQVVAAGYAEPYTARVQEGFIDAGRFVGFIYDSL